MSRERGAITSLSLGHLGTAGLYQTHSVNESDHRVC
jgi:hypothetical protein